MVRDDEAANSLKKKKWEMRYIRKANKQVVQAVSNNVNLVIALLPVKKHAVPKGIRKRVCINTYGHSYIYLYIHVF